MAARCFLVVCALSALVPAALAAQDHPTPTPDVLERLRHHHHSGDWWRITTDSARYEVRVGEIGDAGLAGLTTRSRAQSAPERIAWGSIERIDLRKSHKTRGTITGAILGMSAAFIPLANGNEDGSQPRLFLIGGMLLGGFLGGQLGDQNVHERALYVAPTPPPSPAAVAQAAARDSSMVPASDSLVAAAPDSAASDTTRSAMHAGSALAAGSAAVAATAASPSATNSAAIQKACGRISTNDLLRIQGGFGTFHGYASSVGPEGLGGLRAETRYPSVVPPHALRWDQIERLEKHSGNTQRGAVRGAASVGAFAGLLGFPIAAAASESSDASTAGIVVGCAAVGAGVGAVVGGIIGSTSSSWHLVYQR